VKQKRALEQIGGPIRTEGRADVLAEAWARASDEDPDSLTHGCHRGPARMHPAIARVVLSARCSVGEQLHGDEVAAPGDG